LFVFNEYNKYNNIKSNKSKEFFENLFIFSLFYHVKRIQIKKQLISLGIK